jgi:LTXXQ motif family protein
MRVIPSAIAGLSLLLALPVAAQQAAPSTPAAPSAGAPSRPGDAGTMGGTRMMGRGRMGMMMGSSGTGGGDEDEDDAAGPMRRWHHGPGDRGTPMQIIINIGPDNRVETEEHGRGGAADGPRWRMMGGEWRGRSMADRVAAHLDYLHDQLQLTPEQQPAWDRFATAVRDAVTRMRSGPAGMIQGQSLEQRLVAYETTLNSRLEAIRSIRTALSGLTSMLNDTQKHALDEASAEFVPERSMMGSHWR